MLNTVKAKLAATDDQRAVIDGWQTKARAQSQAIVKESERFRQTLTSAEKKRIEAVKKGKEKRAKSRLSVTVMTDGGKTRTVKRVKTLSDKMLAQGTLPKHLKLALDQFVILVADGYGVATSDGQDSTSRTCSTYEPMTDGYGFGSKTLSDRQIDGLTACRIVKSRMPAEMQSVFSQIISEETGNESMAARSLSEIGEAHGFRYKQASAAGAMHVICICAMISHYLKECGNLSQAAKKAR